MVLFKLAIFLLFPFAGHSMDAGCVEELREACPNEIQDKKDFGLELKSSRSLPTTVQMNEFTKLCQDEIKCAMELDCMKKESNESVYKTCCSYHAATENYFFDEDCTIPILNEFVSESHECTKRINNQLRNKLSLNEILANDSSCILKISASVCNLEDQEYFKKNYDEIIKMYTVKPAVSDYITCTSSPFNKFYKLRCDAIGNVMKSNLRKLKLANATDSDIQGPLELCKDAQRCAESSCLIKDSQKIKMKEACDNLEKFPDVMKKAHEDNSKLTNNNCLTQSNFFDFFTKYADCVVLANGNNCFMDTVKEICP